MLLAVCLFVGCGVPNSLSKEIPTVPVGILEETQTPDSIPEETVVSEQGDFREDIVGKTEYNDESRVEQQGAAKENIPSKEAEKPDSFLEEDGFCYAFEQLGDAEKIWYRDIASMLGSMSKKGTLSKEGLEAGLDEDSIDRVFQSVMIDHPELFYVEGYTYTKYTRGDKILSYDFEGDYRVTKTQAKSLMNRIREEVQLILEKAPSGQDDYEKVKYVYETIIRNTDYKRDAGDNQNIISVFLNHASVCQGYAKAFQYLMKHLGLDCTLVQGTVGTGEGHAWNLVRVNGSFYYVDCTWGDASYSQDGSTEQISILPQINYDYLCVTTEELNKTHMVRSDMTMPVCVENKDNYYVREGAYFTSYDRSRMELLFQGLNSGTKSEVTIKCATRACYDEIYRGMLEEQEVFDYLQDESCTVAYTKNENQLSLSFWVTNEE